MTEENDATTKNREEAVKKRKDASKKKRDAAAAKKKRDAATAAAKKKDAVARKKEKEATAKKKTETAENKRVRDGGADGRSSSTRSKQSQNRETEIEATETASPQNLQGGVSPAPSNEFPFQPHIEVIASRELSSQPQKSPIQAPTATSRNFTFAFKLFNKESFRPCS
ncbi:unnamed protein product [Eruca vesicaria subsp. sativa]|uniref:Uncharacterized protein n=1 Tax=Eruca vesicaria subsp. sativa TaxID=29727 RepID=A0ABC8K2R4_ERUVS|nr:unnamed protein product [Eruca vesicaria subsp. sativa]